jgi:hypothetical protein
LFRIADGGYAEVPVRQDRAAVSASATRRGRLSMEFSGWK